MISDEENTERGQKLWLRSTGLRCTSGVYHDLMEEGGYEAGRTTGKAAMLGRSVKQIGDGPVVDLNQT